MRKETTTMKLRIAALLALSLIPALALAGEEQIRTNSGLEAYRRTYSIFLDHRAFAQSADGAWGISGYRQSREEASKVALELCNRNVQPGGAPCVVININGEWSR